MAKGDTILFRPTPELRKRIREQAKAENRGLGPMVLILLERYFAAQPQPEQPKG
jgi:hypothetical protein